MNIKKGIEEEAAAQGIKNVNIQDGQNDPAKQLAQVEDFIAQGYDIIVINPVEAESLVSAAEACKEAGIPVFSMDRKLETTYGTDGVCITHIGASSKDAGVKSTQIVVDYLKEKYGEAKGNVIYLQGTPGSSAAAEREEGVLEVLKEYPNIKIVEKQTAETKEDGLKVTENLLQKYSDIDAIVSFSAYGALGATRALEGLNRSDIKVTGNGGDKEEFDEILKKNQYMGTSYLNPRQTGRDTITTALKILKGEAVEPMIITEAIPITIDNVNDYIGDYE